MRLIVEPDAEAAAHRAAVEIAGICDTAIDARNRALIAVSGGRTPWRMIELLRARVLRWGQVYVAQTDERIAPPGDPRRNLATLEQLLVRDGPLPRDNLLAMPVDAADPDGAARGYQDLLTRFGGHPLRLDVVHLGLGTDGHTASLTPGDPVLEVEDRDVAVVRKYEGLRRMTLTIPALSRARTRLWLVTGPGKATALALLIDGGAVIPANRVKRAESIVIADRAAAPGP